MHKEGCCGSEQNLYLSFDKKLVVRSISSTPVFIKGQKLISVVGDNSLSKLVGKKVPFDMLSLQDINRKETQQLRVAIICNWNDKCGISTYTGHLVKALKPKVSEIKIFSEYAADQTAEDEDFVDRCWTRGECLVGLAKKVNDWKPDFVIIQHEYGIFPNAFYFMQFMELLEDTPYVVAMHSVYEHLDKLVYTEACRNIIVHSDEAKLTLQRLGNTRNIDVVPHGCYDIEEIDELWNIMQSPYTIMQFGFGFNYKGADRAIEAIAQLKEADEKFENVYYFFLCSTNTHNLVSHNDYYESLIDLAEKRGVRENVAILQRYQSERMLNLYLRLAKMVIFPYVINGDNKVYAASGAVRLAMAHGKPVIASESHLFDDLEGIVPRPGSAEDLAEEIDRVFSDDAYRQSIVNRSMDYCSENTWSKSADKYLDLYGKILEQNIRSS